MMRIDDCNHLVTDIEQCFGDVYKLCQAHEFTLRPMVTEENVSTKLTGPNDPAKMLAIIGSHFRFIYYDLDYPAMDEICEAACHADIIVASDCHGDESALLVPIETADRVEARLIYLGDYYAYVPDYIMWRAPKMVR